MSDERIWRDDFTVPRVVGFVVVTILCAILLPLAEAPPAEAEAITARVAARAAAADLREAVGDMPPARLAFVWTGPEHLRDPVRGEVSDLFALPEGAARHQHPTLIRSDARVTDGRVVVSFAHADADQPRVVHEGEAKIGGWEAVLPPLLAILLALFFRRLLLALGAAVWIGATVSSGWNPVVGVWAGATDFVWGSVSDTFNIYIIGFTLSLVGMVQVITRMGGIAGLLERFRRFTATARSARTTTALLGTAIFFDDYANTIVVGTSMRPITDERKISREKLAYLVDSMSAPVAGIAIISTWVGYEVGLFGEISQQLGLGRSGYDIFFSILPLRFYCLFTIVFVIANAWSGRDYGAMLRAERRAIAGDVFRPGSASLTSASFSVTEPAANIPHHWWNGVLPIAFVILATLLGMFWSGWSSGEQTIPALFSGGTVAGWAAAAGDLGSWSAWREAFGDADSAKVLFWASVGGTLLAIGLAVGQRLLSLKDALLTFLKTIPTMWLAIMILVLAWSIRAVCDDLGTSIYLVGAVQDLLAPVFLPIVTFGLAAVVAFATGTSWGTMGILLPAMVPLAFYLTQGDPMGPIILLLSFGAVLDGAIFGDHCSPISDTTVMSSIASSCDHIDHVRTQLPYAMTTMSAAGIFGYIGVAFGAPVSLMLIAGAVAVVVALFVLGRPHQSTNAQEMP